MNSAPGLSPSPDRLDLRLPAVVALGALYLVAFLIEPALFGSGSGYWLSVLLGLALTALAVRTAVLYRALPRLFFLLLALGFFCYTAAVATYQRPLYLEAVCTSAGPSASTLDAADAGCLEPAAAAQLWMPWMVGFLFCWNCGWGLLAAPLVRASTAPRMVNALTFGVLIVVATFFFMFYQAPQTHGWERLADRFEIAIAALELSGLVLTMATVLLGTGFALKLLTTGFGIFAASDFVAIQLERKGDVAMLDRIDFLWTLGLLSFLAGLLVMPRPDTAAPGGLHTLRSASLRSGLSGLLLALLLGTVLVIAIAHRLVPSVWLSFFLMLFTVACVLGMTRLTARFDLNVSFLKDFSRELLSPPLAPLDWHTRAGRLHGALETTGLAGVLDALETSVERLRDEVIVLGPERLNRPLPARRDDGRITCFVVMPFSLEWSGAVHGAIRRACELEGIQPLRGDDLFKPTDILDDIWQGIAGAELVIADITERNPNVLYELGLAHAIAKPVVILSQSAGDIPVDLATRRVILYDRGDLEHEHDAALVSKLRRSLREVLTTYGWRPV